MDSFFLFTYTPPFLLQKKKQQQQQLIIIGGGEWGQRGPNNKERDIIILHYIIHREVES